jgi:hypothetical protein
MSTPELSTEQARDLLKSWAKTLVNVLESGRDVQEIRNVMIEVIGSAEALEAATEREARKAG